jgi:hypothetical protein
MISLQSLQKEPTKTAVSLPETFFTGIPPTTSTFGMGIEESELTIL